MNRSLLAVFIAICCLGFSTATLLSQPKNTASDALQTPIDIEFTKQMSRSQKDFAWSQTYYRSYKKTSEIPYLGLAAEFCRKTISRLATIQKALSRTTKFYNQADQKRVQACRFYDRLQRQSLLLDPTYHLEGSGPACQ